MEDLLLTMSVYIKSIKSLIGVNQVVVQIVMTCWFKLKNTKVKRVSCKFLKDKLLANLNAILMLVTIASVIKQHIYQTRRWS